MTSSVVTRSLVVVAVAPLLFTVASAIVVLIIMTTVFTMHAELSSWVALAFRAAVVANHSESFQPCLAIDLKVLQRAR